MKTIKDQSLYLVITEEYCRGRSATDVASRALAGGVDIVQMREKRKSMQELVAIGKGLSALCRRAGAIFIANDDPMLVHRVGADGVHLGQEDMGTFPITRARDIIGQEKLIGVSTRTRQQFERANDEDVDYIAFGPVFPTALKDRPVGTGDIEYLMRIAKKPVFFIGGIDLGNIGDILGLGGRNIALVRAITEAEDIEESAKALKRQIAHL